MGSENIRFSTFLTSLTQKSSAIFPDKFCTYKKGTWINKGDSIDAKNYFFKRTFNFASKERVKGMSKATKRVDTRERKFGVIISINELYRNLKQMNFVKF